MTKRIVLSLLALWLVGAKPVEQAKPKPSWLREVEITPARSTKKEEIHFTIRFMPDATAKYETLSFEMTYHQEFPWVNARGQKSTKIHEPVSFKYHRKNVKFVADLDQYVSFRVPLGLDVLIKKFGETTFNRNYPITITRMRISGIAKGVAVWSYEFPAKGTHNVAEIVAAQQTEANKDKGKKEDTSDLADIPDWLK